MFEPNSFILEEDVKHPPFLQIRKLVAGLRDLFER